MHVAGWGFLVRGRSGSSGGATARPRRPADLPPIRFATRKLTRVTSDRALDLEPHFSADGRWLYFTSDRTSGSLGGFDVWTATRADRSAVFGAVTNLQAVNSAVDERPSFVSADGCRLYLERAVTLSQYTVMVAERPR